MIRLKDEAIVDRMKPTAEATPVAKAVAQPIAEPVAGKPRFDRNAYHLTYMREYMRRRRAAAALLRASV